jgi:aspartyl aminopeptidase
MDRENEIKKLKEELFNNKKCGWTDINNEEKIKIFDFAKEYINFMNISKTEREANKNIIKILESNNFKNIEELTSINIGDKVYYNNRGKSVYIAVIGKETLENGLNFIGAHIDSPRLDLKPNPLYEDGGLAYFKTHYYGGIKKYQWTTIPLSIHGVIAKPNGEKIEIKIGEDDNDPIFTITDLLPHLATDQMSKKLSNAIEGESLNLLVGSIPYTNDIKDAVKLNILNILNKKYGITEVDFLSSEIELVPAYGQDDKVCSFAALKAILSIEKPSKTSVCILSDKEEIGSVGNTGMASRTFDYFITELLNKKGENNYNSLEKVFNNSKMISADVDAGFDPIYANVSDLKNASYIGNGIVINKYTGSGGKYDASDANAEYIAYIRNILEENNIKYQVSELGKIDLGGGGTIAYILADKGIEVVDSGVAVLSMHAPYEVTSKYDIYSAYKFYKIFYEC